MEELGRGGRLRGDAAGELVVAAYAAESAHGPRLARGLSLADLAHAVALVEGGDLSREDARSLLRGLLELHAIPGEEFPWDPSLGDAFNAREAELERRVGRSAAGWLSAGRPRREAFRVGLRLTARAGVRELYDALVAQAAALAAHAHATKTALATDYTYLQPAQPTTVGNMLLAYAFPALRDADRARRSHATLGASVAGAGGSAGSRWALDRDRLAELLGCETLVEHAKDAAWQAVLHTGSARTDHFHLLNGTVPRALDEAVAIARLTASVLEGIELRPARFAEIARESFVTAADVADVLALSGELDYRSAHKVVGRAVRDLVDAGDSPAELTPERLAASAEAALGRPVAIDGATLRDALDPAACAAARRQTGSSSASAIDAMLADIDE